MGTLNLLRIDDPPETAAQSLPPLPPELYIEDASRVFGPEFGVGYPAPKNLVLSILFHGALISSLVVLPAVFPAAKKLSPEADPTRLTEIRIGNRLYYVSEIPGSAEADKPAAKKAGSAAAGAAKSAVKAPVET